MNVTSAVFGDRDPAMAPEWFLTISVQGSGFDARAAPIVAQVGSVVVECTIINEEGTEFYGLLRTVPQAGDVLTVGYLDEPQTPTTIVFTPSAVV